MSVTYVESLGWHEGEKAMQSLLHVPEQDNPTASGLTPYGVHVVQKSPLLALGTLDANHRPWTTLLGGQSAFMRRLGGSAIRVEALFDEKHDPVIKILTGRNHEAVEQGRGAPIVSGLPIDLMTRSRLKFSGKLVTGGIDRAGHEGEGKSKAVGQGELVIKIEESLGNCPKYINKKQIISALPNPKMISDSLPLPHAALNLLAKADLFFISTSVHGIKMGTNHRGGPPGFVRVLVNDDSGTTLVFPEYSGNRLYQTLGNLQTTPRAGLVFPDFDTQDVLYVTGTTETLIGKDAALLLPRSNLLIKVHLTAARFIQQGLAFRGSPGEFSPYNPPVRFLSIERPDLNAETSSKSVGHAILLRKQIITPTIARFGFKITDPAAAGPWYPGQYVALAFEDELGQGYSHMRDSDPRSLNDDYIRTFTISSSKGQGAHPAEFEITIRNVGVVTDFLFRYPVRSGLELPLKGFGGSFAMPASSGSGSGSEAVIPFIAGGIGITPFLAQAADLQAGRVRLFWMVSVRDVDLVIDTFQRYPFLASVSTTTVFLSGSEDSAEGVQDALRRLARYEAVRVLRRRIREMDIQAEKEIAETWYLCAGIEVRKSLLAWLEGKQVVYEDFGY